MLTENSFEALSDSITQRAEQLSLDIMKRIKQIIQQLTRDPGMQFSMAKEAAKISSDWERFFRAAQQWTDEEMAGAYLKGIQNVNAQVVGREATELVAELTLLGQATGGAEISSGAARILSDYPRHHTMYTVFQEQSYNRFAQSRIPVIRDARGKIREAIIQASEASYRQADTFTRRQMSQELMDRFAKDNITGIRYSDGRTMKIDSYSEMVARSQTGNAAREASMRRQQQFGLDLVQISQHHPTSDLCEPYQGRVYSISGSDEKYPPLQDAIDGGLYHENCKHSSAAYIPGTSKLPEDDLSKRENRQRYEAEQQQRYNERQIKFWKRREAGALTDDARDKARAKIRNWQSRQREHLDRHSFLRRKYARESI